VRGGSLGLVPWSGRTWRGFAYRHGPTSPLACVAIHPGMVYLLCSFGYAGNYRDSGIEAPPCGSAWRALGHSPHLTDSLDRGLVIRPACKLTRQGLVVHPASQTGSTGSWSFAPPRGLAQQGFGRSPRLTDLLGGDLVVRLAL
jgi:hypothetical protein